MCMQCSCQKEHKSHKLELLLAVFVMSIEPHILYVAPQRQRQVYHSTTPYLVNRHTMNATQYIILSARDEALLILNGISSCYDT